MKRVRLKDGTDVYRVPEKLAVVLVKTNQYVYATRAEWQANGRSLKGHPNV